MSTDKAPDFAGIAKRLAEDKYPRSLKTPKEVMCAPDNELLYEVEQNCNRDGYASCMEARLRSDWETIRLLREARSFVRRDGENDRGLSHRIDAHLSKLLEPFTP